MSRLDDELKVAFRREEPSPDFARRVMERIAAAPEPKKSFWQSLIGLLRTPMLGWVAAGVTAALVVTIGALQYRQMHQVVERENLKNQTATGVQPDTKIKTPHVIPGSDEPPDVSPAPGIKKATPRRISPKNQLTRNEREQQLKEGEAAKEQLLMALHIASSTLNEAQKMVQEDKRDHKAAPDTRR